jgi:hypothetical protein
MCNGHGKVVAFGKCSCDDGRSGLSCQCDEGNKVDNCEPEWSVTAAILVALLVIIAAVAAVLWTTASCERRAVLPQNSNFDNPVFSTTIDHVSAIQTLCDSTSETCATFKYGVRDTSPPALQLQSPVDVMVAPTAPSDTDMHQEM